MRSEQRIHFSLFFTQLHKAAAMLGTNALNRSTPFSIFYSLALLE
jgi:hypothetical protein